MRRPQEILKSLKEIETVATVTDVFKGIASMRISQIKNQVIRSKQFFDELWTIYSQLRVDADFKFGRSVSVAMDKLINKELLIIITAEGGFSGDIDERMISLMLNDYDAAKHDIIVVGHHGALQLAHKGIEIKRYFRLPSKDSNINVAPIVSEVQRYNNTTAYYQSYESLMSQKVKRISLGAAVQELGGGAEIDKGQLITEATYIFEPSTAHVVDHMERSMLYIALDQIILETKLAQYAGRFRAMTLATDRAHEVRKGIRVSYARSRRAVQDERTREVISSVRNSS